MPHKPTAQTPSQSGFEQSDAHARGIWLAGAGLVVSSVIIAIGVMSMLRFYEARRVAADRIDATQDVTPSVATSIQPFPAPRLEVAPGLSLAAFRAREDDELNHYGWIEKSSGAVRLPVERAMDLVARRGLPERDTSDAPPPTRTILDMQQARPSDWSAQAPQAK